MFDLTRIASVGAIFYLLMDIAIHWGLFRYLLKETKANPVIPLVAIALDVIILGAFLVMKYQKYPRVIVVSLLGFVAILVAQRLFVITQTDGSGQMHMEMTGGEKDMSGSGEKKMPDDMDM